MSLSFEEYSALRRRRGEGEVNDVPEDDGAPPAPPAPEAEAQPRISSVHNAGYFFETPEVQLLTLLLIVFDVAAAISSMLITCGGYPDSGILRAVLNMIEVSERDPSRLMRTPVAACYNSLATDPLELRSPSRVLRSSSSSSRFPPSCWPSACRFSQTSVTSSTQSSSGCACCGKSTAILEVRSGRERRDHRVMSPDCLSTSPPLFWIRRDTRSRVAAALAPLAPDEHHACEKGRRNRTHERSLASRSRGSRDIAARSYTPRRFGAERNRLEKTHRSDAQELQRRG